MWVLALVFCSAASHLSILAFGGDKGKQEEEAAPAYPIRLILRTSKKEYRVGEPIVITAYLENTSEKTYYVGSELTGLSTITSLHYILVTTLADNNIVVDEPRGAATSTWDSGTTIKDKLSQAYTLLRPNTLFGVAENGKVMLQPGKYRLRAAYREVEALTWTDSERSALPFPVWMRPLESNIATVVVLPRSPARSSHKR